MDAEKIAKTLSRMAGEDPMASDRAGESYFPKPRPLRQPGVAFAESSSTRTGRNWTACLAEARAFIDFYKSLN